MYTYYVPEAYIDSVEADHARLVEKRVDQMNIRIGPPRKPRSTGFKSQNHHFNGHCQQIAEANFDYFDNVKMDIKRRAISRGYPTTTNKQGDIRPISESEASSADCAMLIEVAHEVASFCNVTLKEAGE